MLLKEDYKNIENMIMNKLIWQENSIFIQFMVILSKIDLSK